MGQFTVPVVGVTLVIAANFYPPTKNGRNPSINWPKIVTTMPRESYAQSASQRQVKCVQSNFYSKIFNGKLIDTGVGI